MSTTRTGRRCGSWSACASCWSAGGIKPTGRLRRSTSTTSTSPAARATVPMLRRVRVRLRGR
eukprot:10624078-Alexandrium_andersonii.AAC.1